WRKSAGRAPPPASRNRYPPGTKPLARARSAIACLLCPDGPAQKGLTYPRLTVRGEPWVTFSQPNAVVASVRAQFTLPWKLDASIPNCTLIVPAPVMYRVIVLPSLPVMNAGKYGHPVAPRPPPRPALALAG